MESSQLLHKTTICAFLLATPAFSVSAADIETDTVLIPERAVVLHGDPQNINKEVLGVFYSREDLAFSDPDAPRFLLVDREGKIVFGLGGQLYATASYDFDGSVDGNGFTTYDIPTPNTAASRQRFGGDLSHSSLFAKLVGKSDKLGMYQVYFQANFTGNNGGYGFKLKQAYVTLHNFTAGLANSTFVDGASQAPTIDPQGPSGEIGQKNILFRYTTPSYKGFKAAASIEIPSTTFTLSPTTESISNRVPDIPVYIQYSWASGQHVRASAIFRDMAYRNLKTGKNKLQPGWGVQLSTITDLDPFGVLQFFGHIAYGEGIGTYMNDLGGSGYDLVPGKKPGELIAPKMMGWTTGLYINVTKKMFFTGAFSREQVYDLSNMGGDAYRYGQYAYANGYYQVDSNFRVGAEYIHGWRKDYNNTTGTANRLNVLLQYSF